MKKAQIEAADVTRRALFPVAPGWYDAYWYGVSPDPTPPFVTRCIDSLRDLIGMVLVRRLARPLRRMQPPSLNRMRSPSPLGSLHNGAPEASLRLPQSAGAAALEGIACEPQRKALVQALYSQGKLGPRREANT